MPPEKPLQNSEQTSDNISSVQWAPRSDDKQAILVSERSAVFDRKARLSETADTPVEVSDPRWDHKQFSVWTPDLIHCRLLVCGQTIVRLPPGMRTGFVSQASNFALSEFAASQRIAPSAVDISVLDWTWPRLLRKDQTLQRILMASAFGNSLDVIVKVLASAGQSKSKATVGRMYLAEKVRMATAWQAEDHPVDSTTVRRWLEIFDRARK
jgi:hypothetical protein